MKRNSSESKNKKSSSNKKSQLPGTKKLPKCQVTFDLRESQCATDLRSSVEFFSRDFLQACFRNGGPYKKETWHVAFAFGTLVRVNLPEDGVDDTWNYTPSLHEEQGYPSHRISDSEKRDALLEVTEDFTRVVSSHPIEANVIRAGMKILLEGGYPLPGGEGADSLTEVIAFRGNATSDEPKEEKDETLDLLFATFFLNLLPDKIQSLISSDSSFEKFRLDQIGREKRRLDFMFPRVVALIDRNATVTFFE
jgi:hypothetical protein